jgi:hypothetical protein
MTDEEIISQAMKLLGHKGGVSRSKLKSEVARLNGASKFMSKKDYQAKLEELQRQYRKDL